ncbi:unnamed protein product [Mytilus coruscus]|uniref:Uncharacterized protein n=1 Tax=Mytilus coruscus TaxID=42192 RepID=A0A6J8CBJ7_MYTCO|nr:unnamed protein product [Mytilus coruscus]
MRYASVVALQLITRLGTVRRKIVCGEYGSDSHPAALHLVKQSNPTNNDEEDHSPEVSSRCTKVCGRNFNGKSCSKTTLAKVYKQNQPDKAIMAYIVLDDQKYKLTSCAGTVNTFGRRATGLVIESLDGSTRLQLPMLIECDIPKIREDIPSPAVARHHDHLREIADYIPEIDYTAPIVLLIGRYLPEAHHILEQLDSG